MSEIQQRQLRRRLRNFERKARWEARWNRLWAHRVGSWNHFFVASVEPIRDQDWWVNLVVGSGIIIVGGGLSRMIGGRFLTGVVVAAAGLLMVLAVIGRIRFEREIRSMSDGPPRSGPENAGVREPRRPPPDGGAMLAALELDHDDPV